MPRSSDQKAINQKTAFDELLVAEITPEVQIQFPYEVSPEAVYARANQSGSVDSNNDMARLQTGAAANSSGEIVSRRSVKFNPGQGNVNRFEAIFAAGTANSQQVIGIGDTGDGFFFGYNGTVFGLRTRHSGIPEVRTLTVTTKSTTAENITITLNSNAKTDVAVTDATSGDLTTTANDIAAADYSDVGRGWDAVAVGATVVFTSWCVASRTGTYSLSSASTAIGTFAQTLVGVADIEVVVNQSSWSEDKMDGTGLSGVTLDQQKLNTYQIKYEGGFGDVGFFIENPATDKLVLVHIIKFANANTSPALKNSTLPLYAGILNGSNTSNLILFVGSFMGGTEGRIVTPTFRHGTFVTAATFTAGTERPVITIRNNKIYKSVLNRSDVILSFAGLSQDSTKTATALFTVNAKLVGASFSDVSTKSAIQVDTSATVISGGEVQFAEGIAKADKTSFQLTGENIRLAPGDTITISLIANANNPDVTAAFNWVDDF